MKRICALILLLMMLLSACGPADVVPTAPELLEPVQAQPKTDTVRREDLLDATSMPGNIAVYTEPVAFIVDGTLESLNVIPGQSVKKGDVLATLNTETLQNQLDALLEQQENAGYINALTNQNLQVDVDICQLKLEELISAQEAALAVQTDALTALQTALEQLQHTNASAIAALEQQIAALQAQLEDPNTPLTDPEAIRAEITALQAQIEQFRLTDTETAAGAVTEMEALQAKIDTLKQQQSLQKQLYELDLQDAQLALKHAKQSQAQAAKQVTTKIELLRSQIEKSSITAPADGTVIWISESKKITAEKAFLYIADMDSRYIRTEEFSDYQLTNAKEIYAIIGNQQYKLTYRPQTVDERIFKSLNDIPIYSFYDFEEGAQIPESMNALVFCVHDYRENVLSIPLNALHRDSLGSYVYQLVDGQKQQVYIKTGMSTNLRVEVISGLEEGDVVYVTD